MSADSQHLIISRPPGKFYLPGNDWLNLLLILMFTVLNTEDEQHWDAPLEVQSPKRSFTISDSSPFIRQRKKSKGSPILMSPRERADSNATNGSTTQIYEWSPISANTEIVISPIVCVNTVRKSTSVSEFHAKSPRSRNSSVGVAASTSHEILTPILKHSNDLDLFHEVSFSSTTDASPERTKSYLPTFDSIGSNEKLDQSDEAVNHPHFLPPNSDEFLLLPFVHPVEARRKETVDHPCPTPTAALAGLNLN
jgi:hypothetical protein